MADIPGDRTTTARLPIGQTVEGVHERDEDADWYRVSLKEGTNYTFRARLFDPDEYAFGTVSLVDPRGRVVASSSSDDYDGYVGGFDYRPSAGGTFFLAVEGDSGDRHQIAFEVDEPAGPPTPATMRVGETRDLDLFSHFDRDTVGIRLEQGKAYDFAIISDAFTADTIEVLDSRGRELDRSEYAGDGTVDDFRAPYTGTFLLRASTSRPDDANLGPYTLTTALDRSADPFDPDAPPTDGDDLLIGDGGADRINGLGGADLIVGRGGNDDLQGGDGDDRLFGQEGRDLVYGGPGDDQIHGDAGDDKLGGNLGADRLWGGGGRDVFDMQAATVESIEDFVRGEDLVDLRRIDAKQGVAGDQAFRFVGEIEEGDTPAAGQLAYDRVGEGRFERTIVYGYTDADADPEFRIFLGDVVPRASDFEL